MAALPARAAPQQTDEDARLMLLFRNVAKAEDALDPLGMIYRGGEPNVAAFRQLYTDAQERAKRAVNVQALAGLRRIDRRKLSPERQISYDVFLGDKREDAAWLRPEVEALTAVRPFNHFGGMHIEFPSLVAKDGALPYTNEAEYTRNLALIAAFPQVLDNAVARFRQGLDSGVVESRLTVT
ncbi:MAG: DUF885 family protein, partial [Pseudomonadota bacterium]|nr:DUF885 family protein [Pseudomonadota bacterium]